MAGIENRVVNAVPQDGDGSWVWKIAAKAIGSLGKTVEPSLRWMGRGFNNISRSLGVNSAEDLNRLEVFRYVVPTAGDKTVLLATRRSRPNSISHAVGASLKAMGVTKDSCALFGLSLVGGAALAYATWYAWSRVVRMSGGQQEEAQNHLPVVREFQIIGDDQNGRPTELATGYQQVVTTVRTGWPDVDATGTAEPLELEELTAYLRTYIACRPRSVANFHSLLVKARQWCKQNGVSVQTAARAIPTCASQAFKMSEAERASVAILRGDAVTAATLAFGGSDVVNRSALTGLVLQNPALLQYIPKYVLRKLAAPQQIVPNVSCF